MHKSSILRMQWFVDNYASKMTGSKIRVLDVGSYDVNGSYKPLFNDEKYHYTGMDMEAGPNVDIVLGNPYDWSAIETDSFDVVISGQAFEHIEFFWKTMEEMTRVLKKDGMLCLIVPNGFEEHRYPVDCYRFFTDGMLALARYVSIEPLHAHTNCALNENATDWYSETCADSMLVARKPYAGQTLHPDFTTYQCIPENQEMIRSGLTPMTNKTVENPPADPQSLQQLQLAQALHNMDRQLLAERLMRHWDKTPVFHFTLLLHPGEDDLLANTLDSLGEQIYGNWRLSVVSTQAAPDPLWNDLDMLDWIQLDEDEDIYARINRSMSYSDGDWVSYIQPGYRFQPLALLMFGDEINTQADCKMIICDEDAITENGQHITARKADIDAEIAQKLPFIDQFGFIEKLAFICTGGLKPHMNLENYALTLRIIEHFDKNTIIYINELLAHKPASSTRIQDPMSRRAIEDQHQEKSQERLEVPA